MPGSPHWSPHWPERSASRPPVRGANAAAESSVAGVGSPELLQASIAAAAVSVLVIADRVFLVEVLVILLGRSPLRGRDDLRDDRPRQLVGRLDPSLRLLP